MSDKKLGLFEFSPYPEAAEDAGDRKKNGPQVDLIGDTPLLLESESPQEELPPQQDGTDAADVADTAVSLETRFETPRYTPFVFESSKDRMLFTEKRVRRVDERIGHDGFLLFIKDFHTATSTGVLRLQGASKYADVLARKKLQEQGELSASEQLLLYGVRRERGREFSVLYQVVPREALRAVEQCCSSHPGGMQYADSLGLLRGVLARESKHARGRDSRGFRACALRVPGALLLLVAEDRRFVLAGRYPFMDSSPRSLSGCLAALRRDVDAACGAGSGGSVVDIRLVETGVREGAEGQLAAAASGLQGFELLPPCILEVAQGGAYLSALPEFVEDFSLSYALGPAPEKLLRPLERFEKPVWALLCAGILFACCVGWFALRQARTLESHATALRQELRRTAAVPADIPRLPAGGFSDRAALAGLLNRAVGSLSLAAVWNRLGAAKPEALSVTSLKLAYAPEKVRVVLHGRVYAELQASQELVLEFIERLRADRAFILAHELKLSGGGEQFLSLELEYLNQERGK